MRNRPLSHRGQYGLDAPYLLIVPFLLIAVNLAEGFRSGAPWPFAAAALIAGCVGLGFHASRRGKFVVWTELLDRLDLRGDEQVLDLGCGRERVLLLAAQYLTTGRATGIDLWHRADQSGNSIEATRRNAVAEGVTDRVEVQTADMTALPFENNRFDLVVSNIAIHNIRSRAGRNKAIDEAVRVLKPGGRLLIADLWRSRQYRDRLVELGMSDIYLRGLGWRHWWTGPWMSTHLVTAIKPGRD